jgi:transcriptional regulator with XRE-family HTH domain
MYLNINKNSVQKYIGGLNMNKSQITLGENISKYLDAKHLSKNEFAEQICDQKIKMGLDDDKDSISEKTVYKWENNEAFPTTKNTLAISKLLGLSLDELFLSSFQNIEELYQKTNYKSRLKGLSDKSKSLLLTLCKNYLNKSNNIYFKVFTHGNAILIDSSKVYTREEIISNYVINRTAKLRLERSKDFIQFFRLSTMQTTEEFNQAAQCLCKYMSIGIIENATEDIKEPVYFDAYKQIEYTATNQNDICNLITLIEEGNTVIEKKKSDNAYIVKEGQSAWNIEYFHEINSFNNYLGTTGIDFETPYDQELAQQSVDEQIEQISSTIFKELINNELIEIKNSSFSVFVESAQLTNKNNDYYSYQFSYSLKMTNEEICDFVTAEYKKEVMNLLSTIK